MQCDCGVCTGWGTYNKLICTDFTVAESVMRWEVKQSTYIIA